MEQEKLLRQLNEFTVIMEEKATTISKLIGRNTSPDRLLVGAEVKRILKISDSTLRRMRNRNDIPFGKIGRSYYYPSNFFEKAFAKKVNTLFQETLKSM